MCQETPRSSVVTVLVMKYRDFIRSMTLDEAQAFYNELVNDNEWVPLNLSELRALGLNVDSSE